ncbi:hypothetical protein J3A83DRAFT_4180677 [Scleroderma citrinum]
MTLLHVYFNLRDQQAFQRLIERDRFSLSGAAAGPSTSVAKSSPGRSWFRKSLSTASEVNAFDQLGRTVLHLACSSTDAASTEYARMLLAHPNISVNIPDKENHWTALHRAMYAGHIEAAILLLKHPDIDTAVKDIEGYTAFDVYNSTVRNAKPSSADHENLADLFTWGANRNAALGLGDGNDHAFPDYVVLPKKDAPVLSCHTLEDRFTPVKVREAKMSKLHTAILTNESRDNLRLCRFGSGRRLGPSSHMIYTPTQISLPTSCTIISVAPGQDHTLALTSAGEVLSWGLNRFCQLGYVVESGQGGLTNEPVQTTPRKITHLKKEFVKGVAACKSAGACWSDDQVWTWGTNGGQLGYSKTATPVQIYPRQVSVITQPVHGIAMTETAMVCLFKTGDVVCLWHGGVSKINFPAHSFPSEISVYRPPQAARGTAIIKLVSCENTYAALSSNGEVFTFCVPEGDGSGASVERDKPTKPQRVWALGRQFNCVRDVDIGGDGTLIVCTQSGHVYVRSRKLKANTAVGGSKSFRFQRIAHIQRAVAVCTNTTGAFGALRVDYKPPPIHIVGNSMEADMAAITPYIHDGGRKLCANVATAHATPTEDDIEDAVILNDIETLKNLMNALDVQLRSGPADEAMPVQAAHGADITIRVGKDIDIPAHRVILASRCKPLQAVLTNNSILEDTHSGLTISFRASTPSSPFLGSLLVAGVNPLSLLVLLHYLYSDDLLAPWDHRIGTVFADQFNDLGISSAQVKAEVTALAGILELRQLSQVLQSIVKRVPVSTTREDYQQLFDQAQSTFPPTSREDTCVDVLAPDVALHLSDKVIYTHSIILRARCPFFSAFFGDLDWTTHRRDCFGVVDVQMGHLEWGIMQFVLKFVCYGEEELFNSLDTLGTVDEAIEFMFRVLAAANELLLTRLVLLCSKVILGHLSLYNGCSLLSDAIHYNAVDLVRSIESYMTANLEMLLEYGILDDLETTVVRHLAEYTRAEQLEKSPITRSNNLANYAMEKHKEWLALQDIPGLLVPSSRASRAQRESQKAPKPFTQSPIPSPSLGPTRPSRSASYVDLTGDELFVMDDAEAGPSFNLNVSQPNPPVSPQAIAIPRPVWKSNPSVSRVDLKAIMTEAEARKKVASSVPSVGVGAPGVPSSSLGRATNTDDRSIPRRDPVAASTMLPTQPLRPVAVSPRTPLSKPQSVPTTPPRSTISQPLGPKITPIRRMPVPSRPLEPRKLPISVGTTWTVPPIEPAIQPSMSGGVLSFAEIQLLQQMHGASTPKEKRSLLEIQEEERSRQQEEDFLRWWAAEEERVRQELAEQEWLLSRANRVTHGRDTGKAKEKKRKPRSMDDNSSQTVTSQSRISSIATHGEGKDRKPHP